MDSNLEFILKLYCAVLVVIDLLLLIYTIIYYKKEYKKSSDDILDVLEKIREKVNSGAYQKKSVLTSVVETVAKDDPNVQKPFTPNQEKKTFIEAYDELSDEQKAFYDEIVDYALTFENTNFNSFDYEKRIKIGQRKMLAIISIKAGKLVVKIKMGNLKVGKGLEPLKLKPINIKIQTIDDVNEAKKQIENCYLKQTGALNVNVEEEE